MSCTQRVTSGRSVMTKSWREPIRFSFLISLTPSNQLLPYFFPQVDLAFRYGEMVRSKDRRESSFDHIGVFYHTQMRGNNAKKSMGISLLTSATVSV